MRAPKKNDSITVRIDPDLKAQLEARAVKDDRTLSAYVGRVLKQHLEGEKTGKAK